MVALQIRDVPEDVRQTLSAQASARGQSLQAFLLRLLTEEARRAGNLAVLERFADRRDGSRLSPGEITATLDRARAERMVRLVSLHEDGRGE